MSKPERTTAAVRYVLIHPVYGPIYTDGEYVTCGAVLGVAPNSHDVVLAPVSGWVRNMQTSNGKSELTVEIDPAQQFEACVEASR